jgi:hypothetical protein
MFFKVLATKKVYELQRQERIKVWKIQCKYRKWWNPACINVKAQEPNRNIILSCKSYTGWGYPWNHIIS